MRQRWVGAVVLMLVVGSGQTAWAQPHDKTTIEAAQKRLDRGNAFFNHNDRGAALAEFMAGYEVLRHPLFAYNIGRVYMMMGRHAKAVQWLETSLASSDKLEPAQRENAAQWLQDERSLVGTIFVTANVDGSSVEIDHEEVAQTPMSTAIRVDAGEHHITVIASGHAPKERDVMVAGQTERREQFDLVPWQHRVARLMVLTEVPQVDVLVDGNPMGKTPLLGSLKLIPGQHRVEVRRAGYVSEFREVTLADGDAETVRFDLKENAAWIGALGGSLMLRFTETHPMVTINGERRGEYHGIFRLAPGVHRLRAERAGFATVEQDVIIAPGKMTVEMIRFLPNVDTLVNFREGVDRRLTWGVVTTVGGLVMAVTGVALMREYRGKFQDVCTSRSNARTGECPGYERWIGVSAAGVGLGVGTLVTGILLIGFNADANRYDMKPYDQKLSHVHALPMVWPGGGGLLVTF